MANDRKMYSFLKDCDRCRVYGTDNTPLADARVQSVGTEVWLYFRTSRLRDARVRTQVDFYDRQSGLLSCLCELLIRRNPAFPQIPEIWMADCRILRVIKMVQRQKDVRVKTHVESEFHTEAGRLFFGTVQNLSAGGLYLRTFQSLKTKQRLTFRWRSETLDRNIACVVIREDPPLKGLFGYGCQFVNLPQEVEEDIRHYVYTEQQKRKERCDEAESSYDSKK